MIYPFEPYPAYKSSDVSWLGDVPAHWEIRPNRAFFSEVNERNCPGEQMLSVTISGGVIPQQELLEDTSMKDSSRFDRTAYKLVERGDIAYNKMRAWQGAIGVSKFRGIVSPAYVVQRPLKGANSRYLHYLLRTPAFAKEAERWSYGITSDMWSLRPEHFKMIYSCVPPLPEQAAIVRFLDHAYRRIRRYIRAKKKLIALLEEQKQAIFHQAVTGQIDVRTGQPYPAYKPSGVEWLGDVPAHWRVIALKRYSRCHSGHGISTEDVSSEETTENTTPVIGGNGIMGFCRSANCSYVAIAIGRVGALCGNVHVVKPPAWITDNALVLSVGDAVVSLEYLAAILRTRNLNNLADRTAQPLITGTRVQNERTPLPTSFEQTAIVSYLDKVTADLGTSAARASQQIELLQEYQTRLIADVVTGKLDVREAAAALPEVHPMAVKDGLDDPLGADVDSAPDELNATSEEIEA